MAVYNWLGYELGVLLCLIGRAGVGIRFALMKHVVDSGRDDTADHSGADAIVQQLPANCWLDLRFVDFAPGGVAEDGIVGGKAGPNYFHGDAVGRRLSRLEGRVSLRHRIAWE